MKCPNCGAAKLVRDTRDMPYAYKGPAIPRRKTSGSCQRRTQAQVRNKRIEVPVAV
ncbi:MAG: type II toxin-antitoxin system MqsA family antitoxin [Betaproteobacteria bacterium]|nr:type II toxin-antitoxin system MqsA family antitoxin [Pseudomonadota bacterium]